MAIRRFRGRMAAAGTRAALRSRLFCFPYAGGGAAVFRQWPDELPSDVELCIPCLPGRDARVDEPPATAMAPLIAALAQEIQPLLTLPYALFGHSMGAFIAFDLAHELSAMRMGPAHLFASAQRGPRLPYPAQPIFALPDADFLAAVRERYQAIPEPVLRQPDLMAVLLRTLRGDFTLVEDYRYRATGRLRCPVTAFGGRDDRQIAREQLEAWSLETSETFDLQQLPGGHFFLNEARRELLAIIRQRIAVPGAG
jgi:medium-chain acyl-[acyl-carrier-protein] hydrolase